MILEEIKTAAITKQNISQTTRKLCLYMYVDL